MKKISELGLEAIQLEDQVLLVKSGEMPENWYLDDANQIRESVIDDPEYWEGRLGYKSIIASTKPLEGLPLLVIEDEVDEIIDQEMIKMGHEPSRVRHPIFGEDRQLAKALYYKGKQTYKFTEEDLRKAIDIARDCESDCGGIYFMGGTTEEIIQSVTKKELLVDTYWNCCGRCIDGEDKCTGTWELNIENNTIKVVWK